MDVGDLEYLSAVLLKHWSQLNAGELKLQMPHKMEPVGYGDMTF